MTTRSLRKERIGVVSSDKMEKSVVVSEVKKVKHPVYGKFVLKTNDTIFIPVKSIHRIENPYKKPVKIIEAQLGSILKETDIVRYQDIYGRVK